MIASHVKISMISLISSLSLKLYLNSLVFHRNIFGSASRVFGNLRQSSEILGKCSGRFAWPSEQFWKSSEIFGKWLEIFGKSSKNAVISLFQYVYIKKEHYTLAQRYEFYVLVEEQYLTRSTHISLVRYCSCHSNIKFISSHHRVISSISLR